MSTVIDWKLLRDTAVSETANGSGFALIDENAWRQFADCLGAKINYPPLSNLSIPPVVPLCIIAKAVWVGDDQVLPKGVTVDVLGVDERHSDVPARAGCWIRWQHTPDSRMRYRSCDLVDLSIDEKTVGRDKNIIRLVDDLTGLILTSDLPKQRWSCSDDESGTILTMNRQRRWTSQVVKEFLLGKGPSERQTFGPNLLDQLVVALKAARGWVLNGSGSPTGKKDLKLIDDALDKTEER